MLLDDKNYLGYGGFAPTDERSLIRWDARRVFFEKMEDLAPHILKQLREVVYPHFRQPAPWLDDSNTSPEQRFSLALQRHVRLTRQPSLPELTLAAQDAAFKRKLLAWLTRFHINEDWISDAALRTMGTWSLGVTQLAWINPIPQPTQALSRDESLFVFEHPGWQVEVLTREQAEGLIQLAFQSRLERYLDHIEQLALERGLRKPVEKRPRHGQDRYRHFEWLIKWQILEVTHESLAAEARREIKTIAAGIRGAAEEIGLTRRSKTVRRRK